MQPNRRPLKSLFIGANNLMTHFARPRLPVILGVFALALGATAAPGQAATIAFDLTGSSNNGTLGNVRTFSNGGVTVTATAWSYLSDFEVAALGIYGSGLGVCNSGEYPGCTSPNHEVDNSGRTDFVLFQFNTPVDPLSVGITTTSNDDLDVSYWVGNLTLPADRLDSETYATLSALGFGSRFDNNGSPTSRTVTLTSGLVNGLLFGAKVGDSNDAFKISTLTVDRPPDQQTVPEPASLLLLGTGLVGMLQRARRRS